MRLPDELATRLELLAHQRRKTMSVLLRDIIERYTARRYSPGRPRRRVHAEDVGVLSSVPALNSAESVAAAVPGAGLPLGADLESLPVLVFSSREEALASEQQIKGWSRKKKEAMMRGDWAEVSRLAKSPSTSSGRTGVDETMGRV